MTSTDTHTAGPWTAYGSNIYAGLACDGDEVPVFGTPSPSHIARMVKTSASGTSVTSPAERWRNACLMAAAPELLEQLKKAYPMIATTSGKAAAQAVIDKATGGAA